MTKSYPDWRHGIRKGIKRGLLLSTFFTLPQLFSPIGDPADGYSAADVWWQEIHKAYFLGDIAGIFGMMFVFIFVVTSVTAAFRPDWMKKDKLKQSNDTEDVTALKPADPHH
jgi:hypothetical protein